MEKIKYFWTKRYKHILCYVAELTGPGSAVVRASVYGTGGPGFDTRSRVIQNT